MTARNVQRIGVVMPLGRCQGGAARCLHDLIASRAAGRVRWHVVLLEPGPLAGELSALGARVSVVPAGRIRQPHRVLLTVARLARLFRAAELDVVVAWMSKAQLYAGPAAALAGVPGLWFQFGLPDRRDWLDRLATAAPARGVLACSLAAAMSQAELRPRYPTHVVYPGIDLTRFDPGRLPPPAGAREILGLPVEGPIVGSVGRLQRRNGMHVLVDAFPAVLRRHPDAHCVLVGGPHALEPGVERMLRRRAAVLGIADRVLMPGARDDVPLWMQAMDVFVRAADAEPFGFVVVEAMALGKPVVVGAVGGPAEVVTPGRDGASVRFGDAAGVAQAVLGFLGDPAAAATTGRAAAQRARDFSVGRFATRLLDVLDPRPSADHRTAEAACG